jgi:hypothetical protein
MTMQPVKDDPRQAKLTQTVSDLAQKTSVASALTVRARSPGKEGTKAHGEASFSHCHHSRDGKFRRKRAIFASAAARNAAAWGAWSTAAPSTAAWGAWSAAAPSTAAWGAWSTAVRSATAWCAWSAADRSAAHRGAWSSAARCSAAWSTRGATPWSAVSSSLPARLGALLQPAATRRRPPMAVR